MSNSLTTQAAADSGETQSAADVDKTCSAVEIHRESDVQYPESDAETTSVESNGSETSELSYTTSYFEELFEMYDIRDVMTNAEEKKQEQEKEEKQEEQDSSPLHFAAKDGLVEVVRSLLMQSNGSDVNVVGAKKNTPLHYAASFGHKDVVDLLLSNNSRVDSRNAGGRTPLHLASENGHLEIAQVLLDSNADADITDQSHNTSLHIAAMRGHYEVVQLLLKYGKVPRIFSGHTPLHLAAKCGHTEIVELLLKYNEDTNAINLNNETPLHFASENGHFQVAKVLLRNNANANIYNASYMTSLHVAAEMGHTEIVKGMMVHHGETNAVNKNGDTPHHLALRNGHRAVANILLNHTAQNDAKTRSQLPVSQTLAAEYEILQYPNRSKADVRNLLGQTPLHIAAQCGHLEIVNALLNHSASINAYCHSKATPVHLAAEGGHTEIVEYLICHGAAVNECDKRNMTPLHLAAQNGHNSIVVLLLDNHATVDVMKQSQKTLFYLAAKNGHAEVVDELLLRGVSDFNFFDEEKTPLHVAVEKGHTEVVKVILKHSCRTSEKFKEDGYKLQQILRNLTEKKDTTPVELKKCDGRYVSAEIVWTETTMPLEIMRESDGYNALELAVRSIQPKMVEILLDRDQCVYSEEHLGDSFRCLTEVLLPPGTFDQTYVNKCRNILKIAEVLVKSDRFNVNYQGKELNTPLHEVLKICGNCFYDNLIKKSKKRLFQIQTIDDLINLLLEKGADFNLKNSHGETSLIVASQKGCRHAVQTLLDWEHKSGMKFDMDARDQYGATALIKAAETHHVAVMRLLLNNEASVNLYDYYGYTALHAAIYEPNRNWFDLHFFCKGFRKRKYDIKDFLEISQWGRPTWGSQTVYPYEAIKRLDINLGHDKKTTRFKEEMVKLLLGSDKINMDAMDFRGNTPFDLAVKSSKRINSATFNELEKRGAIQNQSEPIDEESVNMARIDERGRNPLHRLISSHVSNYAIEDMKAAKRELDHERYDLMVFGILLQKENFRQLANATDDRGRTPLHYAVMPSFYICKQHRDLVRVLLEFGCSVNATDIYGKTPLHYAEMNDQYNLLLAYGANENTKDKYGYTARDLKQLRDSVTFNLDNAKNLPIRMKTLYMSRQLNTNHTTELTKQNLATKIKICSQSSRSPESSEEAIWKIWIQNNFTCLNRRVRQLKIPLQHFMDRLAHSIKEKDWRFECQPILVGSADEETKAVVSADFDYNFKLTKLSQLCEVVPHPLGPEGYFQLKRKSKDDTKSRNDEDFDCFFNSDQCLLTHEINSRFHTILEEVLSDPNFWKGEHLFEWNITDRDEKKSEKPAGLCKTVRLKMIHPIDDGEGGSLFGNISTDVVACVYMQDWWPRDPLPGVETDGCTMVFDRPRFDPSKPRVDHFLFSETFARISFASVESRIIKDSSPLMKAAYIVCKIILYDQPKTTYQLKNCLLFCMEALNARNRSETRNEDKITPKELAFWVERVMFCFIEFSRHAVYPCYCMPSFRQRVIYLYNNDGYMKFIEEDEENVSSSNKIPFQYSAAYGIYLDLCPDDIATDIPIHQKNYDYVNASLNANLDPMWEHAI